MYLLATALALVVLALVAQVLAELALVEVAMLAAAPAYWTVSVWACPSGCSWVGRKAGHSVWLWRSALGSRFQWV